mgnify:CR=1 FL=1
MRYGRPVKRSVTIAGHETAVGLIQVRRDTQDCSTAEWGFVLGERFWGTGLFMASADLLLRFLFETLLLGHLLLPYTLLLLLQVLLPFQALLFNALQFGGVGAGSGRAAAVSGRPLLDGPNSSAV